MSEEKKKKKVKTDEKDIETKVVEKIDDIEVDEDITKTDEIDNIEDEDDTLDKTKVLETIDDVNKSDDIEDTKEVVNIEDVEEEIAEEKDSIKKEIDEEKTEKEDNSFVEKKSNKGRNIVTIILICIILVLFTILIYVLNEERKEEEKDSKPDKDITDIVLTEDEKKEMINSYGKALESVILVHYQKNQTILTFEEANKLVELENDVVCSEHEIYEDGKVYLTTCSVNGKMTEYTYGEKQEPKEEFDSGTMIKVYVNSTTGARSLTVPSNMDNVLEYTVHCDEAYENPTLLGNSDYVFYFDSEYNVKMKNYVTDIKALEKVNYTKILPFMIEDNYYDTTYVAVYNGSKWGIYNLESATPVVGYVYDVITTLSTGVGGPGLSVSTLKGTNVAVYKNGKYGVIDYTSGVEIIPVEHDSLMRSGNYLWATHNDGTETFIYDFSGNNYLTEGYDKIYGISEGTYVLVAQDDVMRLIQMDGKVLYEYGEVPAVEGLNFALEYNGGPLFQLYKEDSTNDSMCVEYSYDPSSKTGESKEIFCGGVAKPVLYLYPEEETEVTVSFSNPEILETTYPKFNNYWRVTASPNGDLLDQNNKYYYALYWDEKKVHTVDFSEGYYVEKDDAIKFLEEKLSYIGLNDKERNEFIMYWLPVLEKNGKSLVYFELTEERESYNKLLINPQPDSMLRLVIHIKKVDEKVNIKKQSLSKFKRRGFTVVEWGGTTY